MSTSSGRKTGCRNVRWPSKSRDMKQPERLGDQKRGAEEHENLQDAVASHSEPLELLGLEHRPPEVHEQEHRDNAGQDVVEHGFLSDPIAGLRDRPECNETDRPNREIQRVKHLSAPLFTCAVRSRRRTSTKVRGDPLTSP